MAISTYHIKIKGQVQGVGFRPFVYNLAQRLNITGNVANGPEGVEITAHANEPVIQDFLRLLSEQPPAMSQIESIHAEPAKVAAICDDFLIVQSRQGEVDMAVTPDASVCPNCLNELFDPNNRRYLYPFINCTHCGPRYSIIKALPYDRKNTTMAEFELCGECEHEYTSPLDRRFHAQPNACEECGPELSFHDREGEKLSHRDPLGAAVSLIQQGKVVAIKGIGGFHLVCDARNPQAIEHLRHRKHRDKKPFAVMATNVQSLEKVVELNQTRKERLSTSDAPICLCPKGEGALPEAIAPDLAWLGVMLPHSPLHYLLFHRLCGKPSGHEWLKQPQRPLLVMTSANLSGMPLITDNDDALIKLQGIADGFLLHNRDIHTRCDDSVVSVMAEKPALIRRGRGLSPQLIPLSCNSELPQKSVLALGGFYKNTVCLTKGNQAYVSQYIGDLDNPECCRTLAQTVEAMKSLLNIEPDLVVCDKHPDFFSTRFATDYAHKHGLPLETVQHHHAHIAAVIAEHGAEEPVIGVALDGLGLGDDGTLWGGEFLYVNNGYSERLSHLPSLPLPGGDKAAKEPWRMASAVMYSLGQHHQIETRFAHQPGVKAIQQLLDKQLNCPETSSAGRLFDAVSAMLGICEVNAYEAQAAMQLESLAWEAFNEHGWPEARTDLFTFTDGNLDFAPLFNRLLACSNKRSAALLFHQQLVSALFQSIQQHAQAKQCSTVVLAGGCFLNQLLLCQLTKALRASDFNVLCAEKMPCNDGAISLGQAHVAIERAMQKKQKQQQNKKKSHKERDRLCV